MKLYLAALLNANLHLDGEIFKTYTPAMQYHRRNVNYLLESYHYCHKQKSVDAIRQSGERIFLDSGAFSAFTMGVQIDLPGYCDYIKRNADIIEMASVLDAVGDPQKTYENQLAMEAHDVKPLPCFHYGEDIRYLEHYMANYEYITLGGMVPISNQQLFPWLDRLWEKYLCGPDGSPRLKVHGFGLTSVPLMARYPWFSVDSSSWLQYSAYGHVFHPDFGVITVSSKSPSRKTEGKHFNTFSESDQWQLLRHFESLGFTLEQLAESYQARYVYCMWSFTELNKRFDSHGQKFVNEQPGLF